MAFATLALALLIASQDSTSSPAPIDPASASTAAHKEARAQGDRNTVQLGETLVTPALYATQLDSVPFVVDSIDSERIARQSYRNLPQALRDTPGVFVLETSYGQGSPYIRGWTGFRNLLLVDGVRLNNSVFRDGPNQYWNTVDLHAINNLEVVKGPGAVLYGSDSVGGTVNALTRSPWTYLKKGAPFGGSLGYRFSSAEHSSIARADADLRVDDDTAVGIGVTGKRFHDFEAGRSSGHQPNTGFGEWDFDLKLERALDEDTRLLVAHQHTKQNGVPRTHKTIFGKSYKGTTVGNDLRRDFDQERVLTYVQLRGEDIPKARRVGGVLDGFTLNLSWQSQEEKRDRIRSSGSRDLQGFDDDTLGLFAWGTAPSSLGRFTFGADWYRDFVDSFSTRNPIQGPVADNSTYDLIGAFLQDQVSLSKRADLVAGLRVQHAIADADRVSDPTSGNSIGIHKDFSRVVGSVRSIVTLNPVVDLITGISQAFRAPNLSDLTRFDSARTNEFEIASPNLKPETFTSFETGVRADDGAHKGDLTFFYTDVHNLIIRRPTGNTNADGEFEIKKENAGEGHVLGVEGRGAWTFLHDWTLFAKAAFTDGKVKTFPSSLPLQVTEPIDRLLPWQGHTGLRFEQGQDGPWAEFRITFAGKADKLSTRDKADTQRIPPGGTPGYAVLDLRAGRELGRHVRLEVSLENLLNADYRVHGSGQNQPGRSLVIGLTITL